ncbi:MAG: hypothetical protein L0207_05070 [Chlamydiae bacterium]|nr:hypothetical protein [Chlamydiota bacterium]
MYRFCRIFFILIAIPFSSVVFAIAPPWIDLPEDDYSKLALFEDERFIALNDLVVQYHSIPKTSEDHLKERIQALQKISNFLSVWIHQEKFKHRRYFLSNIERIASNKRWYLNEIYVRYINRQFEMDYLKSYHEGLGGMKTEYEPIYLAHRRLYDSNIGIYWGEFWYETIDPCHRQLTPYYDLWRKQQREPKPILSFFMWLEDQNLSRDISFIEFLDQEQLDQNTVFVNEGVLYLFSKGKAIPVDYCEEGKEYIFSIDLAEKLLLIPVSKTIHHSSLSHGKPVLGSGNMTVSHGKITSIQLESGHYLPTLQNGLQILDILKKMGILLEPSTPFAYYDSLGKHEVTLGEFQCAFR